MFRNKYFILTIFLLVCQQLIVASSNYWLKELSQSIHTPNGQLIYFFLALYILSLVVPYFPGASATICATYWKEDLIKKFSEKFIQNHAGRIDIWSQSKQKDIKTVQISNVMPNAMSDFCSYFTDLTSVGLNIALNVLALVTLIESNYLAGFLFSFVLLALLTKYQFKVQNPLEKNCFDSRVILASHWNVSWDNLLIRNPFSFENWNTQFENIQNQHKKTHAQSELMRQIFSVVSCLITFVPVFSIAVYSIVNHSKDSAHTLGIIVTLPRLFMIMNFTHAFVNLLFGLPMQKTRLKEISDILEIPEHIDLQSRIKRKELSITSAELNMSVDELLQDLQKSPGRRFTIRGPNGAGKSTFLQNLKQDYKNAIYLPSNASSLMTEAPQDSIPADVSTGQKHFQKLMQTLSALKSKNTTQQILLLDEWDANLDHEKIQELDSLLAELSKTLKIVEVRHR